MEGLKITKYEELKQAVKDGKFKKHIASAKISRMLIPNEHASSSHNETRT